MWQGFKCAPKDGISIKKRIVEYSSKSLLFWVELNISSNYLKLFYTNLFTTNLDAWVQSCAFLSWWWNSQQQGTVYIDVRLSSHSWIQTCTARDNRSDRQRWSWKYFPWFPVLHGSSSASDTIVLLSIRRSGVKNETEIGYPEIFRGFLRPSRWMLNLDYDRFLAHSFLFSTQSYPILHAMQPEFLTKSLNKP